MLRLEARRLSKLLALAFVVGGVLALGGLRRGRIRRLNLASRVALRIFGLELDKDGGIPDRPALWVANHLSYVDAIMLASLRPAVFVTSEEIAEDPILGPITRALGCIYIERRNRERIAGDLERIARVLREGVTVVLFPEGTSSNGARVLPFHAALLPAAAQAGVPIVPVALAYSEIDGARVSPANRDRICYYGDMNFTAHLWSLLGLRSARARLQFLEPLEATVSRTRHELAQGLHSRIAAAL